MSKDKAIFDTTKIVPIDDVIPYEANVKQHPINHVRKVAASINNYGWDQPIVVDKDMVIIKGHGRLLAAKYLQLTEIPIVINDSLTEEEIRLSRIADNKVAESEWDKEVLWEELKILKDEGLGRSDMSFDSTDLRKLFPDEDLTRLGVPVTQSDAAKEKLSEEGMHDDATRPVLEAYIGAHEGDEAYLRKLSMVDYLNWHDKILVGFSGGKDSLAALLWCLENVDRSKLQSYFSNLAWGVDWPHGLAFVQFVEKKYGIKVFIAGSSDPKAPGKWHDMLLQHGYPHPHSCWYRNYFKIRNIRAFLEQEKLHPRHGVNSVQVVAVRWSESKDRRLKYPDRGFLKDEGIHYASPLLKWTDGDVIHFLEEREVKLHTAYQHTNRMGCIVCPNEPKEGCINTRKKLPLLFRQILDWHGRAARRRGLQRHHFARSLMSLDDITSEAQQSFQSHYSAIALSSREFEDYIEESLGIKLAQRPYVTVPFDKNIHNFRNDLKPGALEEAALLQGYSCDLQG